MKNNWSNKSERFSLLVHWIVLCLSGSLWAAFFISWYYLGMKFTFLGGEVREGVPLWLIQFIEFNTFLKVGTAFFCILFHIHFFRFMMSLRKRYLFGVMLSFFMGLLVNWFLFLSVSSTMGGYIAFLRASMIGS